MFYQEVAYIQMHRIILLDGQEWKLYYCDN